MRTSGHVGCSLCELGDLPENWQNSLYAIGSPNSNYQDGISGSSYVVANSISFMRDLAAKGYPPLPYASAGIQTPGVIPSEIPAIYKVFGKTPAPISATISTPPPILIYTPEPAPAPAYVPPPAPVYIAPPAPVYVPPPAPFTPAPKYRTSLEDIPEDQKSAFPMDVRAPSVSGNVFWYTGQPVLNRGIPVWSNDANEFLRNAMIASDWNDVEIWLGWAIANGYPQDQLHLIDFGRFKYVQDWNTGTRTYFPFSPIDYETFFTRFLKYASAVPADADCIRKKLDLYRRGVASNPRNQFRLQLADCPLTTGWALGLLKAVAVIAIPYAIATAATAIAAAAATSSASTAGAVATAIGTGAAPVATPLALAAPVIETVVVTAAAPSLVGTTIAAGLSTGAVIAGAAAPPISVPQAPAAVPSPIIETVITQASALPSVTVGQAITAGAIATAAAAPALITPTIETVVVEAPTIREVPLDPATVAATGITALEIALPQIELEIPQAPEYDDESLRDQIKDKIKQGLKEYGIDYLKQKLAEYLQSLLGRIPTDQEINEYQDFIEDEIYTALPGTYPQNLPPPVLRSNLLLVAGIVAAFALLSGPNKGRKR